MGGGSVLGAAAAARYRIDSVSISPMGVVGVPRSPVDDGTPSDTHLRALLLHHFAMLLHQIHDFLDFPNFFLENLPQLSKMVKSR